MVEDTSAKTTEPAETQEEIVEETVEVSTADTLDYEAEMAAKDAEIERLSQVLADKDAGLKKYKAIAKGRDDWSDDEDEDTLLSEKQRLAIKEETEKVLAQSELAKALQEKEELAKKALRENKELKLALQNKPGAGTSRGSGADTTEAASVDPLPASTVAELKGKGWSDEKIQKLRENYAKGNK